TDRFFVSSKPTPAQVAPDPVSEQPEVLQPRPAGRPVATSPRYKRVSMSLTEAELQAWSATAVDQALSALARLSANTQSETDSAADGVGGSEIQRLRADLGRVGSNVNQLTRGMHQGQLTDTEELVAALDQVSQHLAAVRRALP